MRPIARHDGEKAKATLEIDYALSHPNKGMHHDKAENLGVTIKLSSKAMNPAGKRADISSAAHPDDRCPPGGQAKPGERRLKGAQHDYNL